MTDTERLCLIIKQREKLRKEIIKSNNKIRFDLIMISLNGLFWFGFTILAIWWCMK